MRTPLRRLDMGRLSTRSWSSDLRLSSVCSGSSITAHSDLTNLSCPSPGVSSLALTVVSTATWAFLYSILRNLDLRLLSDCEGRQLPSDQILRITALSTAGVSSSMDIGYPSHLDSRHLGITSTRSLRRLSIASSNVYCWPVSYPSTPATVLSTACLSRVRVFWTELAYMDNFRI
jgi:hypothetical protein